jgi:proteasome ATPase
MRQHTSRAEEDELSKMEGAMPRRVRQDIQDVELRQLLDRLSDAGASGPSLNDQLSLLQQARQRNQDAAITVDKWLVSEIDELRHGLAEARHHLTELRRLHARLTSAPWFPAVFVRRVPDVPDKIVVAYQGTPRVVTLDESLNPESLSVGDDVLLTHDLNVAMQRLTPNVSRACEVAEFQQSLNDNRLILKSREAEVIVGAADTLDTRGLSVGDRVRWDPASALAFERLPRTTDSGFFLAETPVESFADVGGLDAQIELLQQSVRLHMHHPDLVRRYQLKRVAAVLLVGPPGTGKTMVARALARWLGQESPAGRSRFMYIKPAALHSMWFAQSEANYREVFRVAREAGSADPTVPVVMFFDEVDAIATIRGHAASHHVEDRVLTSFMAELDGLEARGNILVVAATNRRDALDPALLRPGRLGDLVLEIPRPSLAAARAIMERHLAASAPYAPTPGSTDARRDVIETAISRLYAPNGEGEVGWIMFRDGTRRAIHARDLVSGAMLANVARLTAERACVRELETGDAGIRDGDVLDAISDELSNAVRALTPANCLAHMAGLPQDVTVVRVEPTVKTVKRPHRFLRAV